MVLYKILHAKKEASCPESFSDFIEGFAYAKIVVSEESINFIQDNPASGTTAILGGLKNFVYTIATY